MKAKSKNSLQSLLPANWHREPGLPRSEFECRCTHCDRTLIASTGRGGQQCRQAFDIMTCCGCSETSSLTPRCVETYAPIPTAAAEGLSTSTSVFSQQCIEATSFDWPELTGKLLRVTVGESEGHTIVIGEELEGGHVYVLHHQYHNILEE